MIYICATDPGSFMRIHDVLLVYFRDQPQPFFQTTIFKKNKKKQTNKTHTKNQPLTIFSPLGKIIAHDFFFFGRVACTDPCIFSEEGGSKEHLCRRGGSKAYFRYFYYINISIYLFDVFYKH